MRLHVDDDIYRVDGVWLGPPQRTLPWRARYVAYGVGLGVFLLLQVVERRVGIGISFWTLSYSLLITIALTRLALSVVDHDRTVWSVVTAFVHEVGAPRAGGTVRTAVFRPRRIGRRRDRRRTRGLLQPARTPRHWQPGKA